MRQHLFVDKLKIENVQAAKTKMLIETLFQLQQQNKTGKGC